MRILTVTEITAYLKDLVELDPILSDVWIRGEVTNMSRSAAGHMYFCLVADGVQINCVLFRGNQFGLLAVPRNGEEVLAHGRISLYEIRGQYQLMVDNVAPVGVGILQLQFEDVRRRLEAEGLFATERKRPLPLMPATIGVVTSAQGAVWHDIQNVVARRFPLVELVLAPSAVQGPDAPQELVRGLRALDALERCDVIIIGRGGGSAEDLAAFNDEGLARAIYAASVPVISAVGHETDVCIADLVADVRAPTPSAAAEICVPDREEIIARLGFALANARAATIDVFRTDRDVLRREVSMIDRCSPTRAIQIGRQQADTAAEAARSRWPLFLAERRNAVDRLTSTAGLLDPREVMRRGYAVVSAGHEEDGQRIHSAAGARAASTVTVAFHDGAVRATVQQEHK